MIFATALMICIYLLIGIIIFDVKRSNYNGVKQTISELGENGAHNARLVNFLLFLPVGLALFFVALVSDKLIVQGLASCIGTGYVIAAIFPCDPGSPLDGSWRQQVHNLGGFAQYVGSIYFLNEASIHWSFLDSNHLVIILIVCTVVISIPSFSLRGLVQRIAELILFSTLVFVS